MKPVSSVECVSFPYRAFSFVLLSTAFAVQSLIVHPNKFRQRARTDPSSPVSVILSSVFFSYFLLLCCNSVLLYDLSLDAQSFQLARVAFHSTVIFYDLLRFSLDRQFSCVVSGVVLISFLLSHISDLTITLDNSIGILCAVAAQQS